MRRFLLRSALAMLPLTVALAATVADSAPAAAQDPRAYCAYRVYGSPDLFYNFYVPPNCGGMGANLYVAPLPVPPVVGHTYYTYQPLMPHEMLYPHHRAYYRYYEGGRGLNRTHVSWYNSPTHVLAEGIGHLVRLPR